MSDWREGYAYSLGIQAYVFGFPYVYLPSLRWNWVTVPKPPGSVTPYAALNHFHHARTLADASYREGGSPNSDTLYSIAWLDLRSEPVILSHPSMGDRYFAFEMASLDSDNFAYVGSRTTGSRAASFAIVGPNWSGRIPDGVRPLPLSRTSSVLIIGRTLVDGPDDRAAANALQDRYALEPLSLWGRSGVPRPASRLVWKPVDTRFDPLAEWRTMNRAMTEDPPELRVSELLKWFATVGIGPGQDLDAQSDATRAALARAAVDGRKMLSDAIRSGQVGRRVNGWTIPPRSMGRAGLADDFLLRGSVQCLGGIIANDPEEAVYFNTAVDGEGEPLNGASAYTIRFGPGQLPDCQAFWSLTAYDTTYNLVANPINRHAIGNRTHGLRPDADGGLTLYLQSTRPGGDRASNWLPTPRSGPVFLIFRTYIPGPDIVSQQWAPPAVTTARAIAAVSA